MSTGEFTLATAREASRAGRLADWVRGFLASPGSDNADLADLLDRRLDHWVGPVLLPFDHLHRLAGPPDQPVLCPIDDDEWRDDVEDLAEQVDEGWEPPPMVVSWKHGSLVLEDGNHRVEGMRRAGLREAWCLVGFESETDRVAFLEAWEPLASS